MSHDDETKPTPRLDEAETNDISLEEVEEELIKIERELKIWEGKRLHYKEVLRKKKHNNDSADFPPFKSSTLLESFIQSVVENVVDGIIVIDANGVIEHFNAAAERLFGYTTQDILGQNISILMPSPHSEKHDEYIQKYLETGISNILGTSREVVAKRRDGSTFPVDMIVNEMKLGKGPKFTAIVRDITERKRNEARIRSIVETAVDGIIVIDSSGIVEQFNPAAERIFGYPAAEIVGNNIRMLMPNPFRAEHDQYLRNYLQTGEKKIIGIVREVTGKRKNGTTFPMELAVSEMRIGEERKFTGIVKDITERKNAEARIKAIIDNAADGIVVIDSKGIIEHFNPAAERLFGYTQEEVHHENVSMLMPNPYKSEHDQYIKNFLVTGRKKIIGTGREVTGLRKDGTTFPLELTVTEMKVGEEIKFTGIIRDITERKQASETVRKAQFMALQAEAANQAKSDFMATMSHEIRTPMNSVLGMTSLLLDTKLTLEQHEYCTTIQTSAESLLTIINDILDFSKIEAGKMTLEPIQFNLLVAIEEVFELLAQKSIEKGLELLLHYSAKTPLWFIGDPGRFRQILVNLISNAIKFTMHGHVLTTIELVEENADGQAKIQVTIEDTGIGIPEQALPKLFSRFTQADSSTTRQFGGTGLGLAITKHLVQMMSGAVSVVSKVGQGSTFRFYVWLTKSPKTECIEPIPQMTGARVLVVDDHNIAASALTKQLSYLGLRASSVGTSQEALKILEEAFLDGDPFHIAIIDRWMPELNGVFLAKAIVQNRNIPDNTALIAMTPTTQTVDYELLKQSGYIASLFKPIRWTLMTDFLLKVWNKSGFGQPLTTILPTNTAESRMETPQNKAKPISSKRDNPVFDVRALLAEDNIINQKVAALHLKKLGCRIDVAANGKEAVDMASSLQYDIVFMDCQMPEMDGYEATREIRLQQSSTERHLPIIALTANAMKGEREKCLSVGMDHYITKPILKEDLISVLYMWCAHKLVKDAKDKDPQKM